MGSEMCIRDRAMGVLLDYSLRSSAVCGQPAPDGCAHRDRSASSTRARSGRLLTPSCMVSALLASRASGRYYRRGYTCAVGTLASPRCIFLETMLALKDTSKSSRPAGLQTLKRRPVPSGSLLFVVLQCLTAWLSAAVQLETLLAPLALHSRCRLHTQLRAS